jgi:hypothetical protein
MNKFTRLLTMTGMGVLAAVAISAGPAQAADNSGTAAARRVAPQVQQHDGGERTVGYYRSLRSCELAGRIGERFGRWADHDCDFVRFGFHRRTWALQVSNRGWGRPGHRFPGHSVPGHSFPGQGFPGQSFPGQGFPDQHRTGFPGAQARPAHDAQFPAASRR